MGANPLELAHRYEHAYLEDMRMLRNDSVDVYARASDHVGEVVDQVERLLDAGAAYATPDGVGRLIEERGEHRRHRRFAEADRIRERLAGQGVLLEDTSTGVRSRRTGG